MKEEFGELYNEKNVVLSATHTHSGPGGYFKTYALNIFAGMTFHDGNFKTIVDGIYDSIVMAHESLVPGKIYYDSREFSSEINNSNKFSTNYRINRQRSVEAYYLNRDVDNYKLADGRYDDTNRRMTQLKFIRNDGELIGLYNWTPVHPNISGSHLSLINGDVMGYASYMFEKEMGTDYVENNNFVAAFAQNDCGDTSGNLPEDSFLYDDIRNRDLNDKDDDWIADGTHDYERVKMRAETVYKLADEMSNSDGIELKGEINFRQMYIYVQQFKIDPEYIDDEDIYYSDLLDETKDNCTLCNGAAGVGFFAGSTEDGDSGQVTKGEGDPREISDYSMSTLNDLFIDPIPAIADILLRTLVPKDELYQEMDCQLEKRMTLNFDELNNLIPGGKAWNLNLPVQIVKIGNLAIIALPLEVTTMSGRRIKAELKKVLPDVEHIVINATSNSDGRYLTTREEYSSQQYEGGATLLGPYSLNAVRQIIHELAESFEEGVDLPDYAVGFDAFEEAIEETSIVQIAGNVVLDDKPLYANFGDVKVQPESSYSIGQVASTVFWGAHPNNNLTVKSHESFLVIEKKLSGSEWNPVAYDWDPETRYMWKRNGVAYSKITVEWHIPDNTDAGEYRIRHIGQWKSGWTGKIKRYEGVSDTFLVN